MPLRFYLLLSILIISVTSSCQKKSEDCIYIVNKGFEGTVLIVFDQNEGEDTLYEGKSRIYKINKTGVLKTKFKPNYGIHHNMYVILDSNENRVPIKYFSLSQLQNPDDVICFNHEAGKDYDYKKKIDRHFEVFTIAKQRNIETVSDQRSSFMSKILGNN